MRKMVGSNSLLVIEETRRSSANQGRRDDGRESLPCGHQAEDNASHGQGGEAAFQFLFVSQLSKSCLVTHTRDAV